MTNYWLFSYLWGLAAVLTYLILGQLAGSRCGGLLGVVQGEDGRLSSSKFQFFVWTGIVVFAWVALFVAKWVNGTTACTSKTGDLPGNVLLAMGFSVITLATAKGITTAYVYSGRVAKGASTTGWKVADLFQQDDGSPDLTKIQMLTWTVIAGVSYLFSVCALIPTFGRDTCDFPDISAALMALMGIGQGAYLAGKAVAQTVTLTNLSPTRGPAGCAVTINGSGFGSDRGSVLFGKAVTAFAYGDDAWTDTTIKVIAPTMNPDDNQAFMPGDTVDVSVLTAGANASASNDLQFTYTKGPPP
jgi:hypothetical protein